MNNQVFYMKRLLTPAQHSNQEIQQVRLSGVLPLQQLASSWLMSLLCPVKHSLLYPSLATHSWQA
jgi:hypothetical protein